jgi:hypothetical protein
LAGCRDRETAAGYEDGGAWSKALCGAWQKGVTIRSWFDGAARLVREPLQTPLLTWVNAEDEFKRSVAWMGVQ